MVQLSNQKIRIHLHGRLKKFSSDVIEVSVSTVEEAIHALSHHCPKMKEESLRQRPTIQVKGYESVSSLREPLAPTVTDLHILPAFCGAGGKAGALVMIAIGVALVVASGGLAAAGYATLSSIAMSMGVGLALGGLMQLIAPSPSRDSGTEGTTDPEASKYLGATQNTTKIGTRIPLIYGKMRTGGHYISFDVDAKDVEVEEAT